MTRVILVTVGTSLKTESAKAGRVPEEFLRDEPRGASAESNLLDRLLKPQDRVLLLHSDTDDGNACACELAQWLSSRKVVSELVVIEGLNYKAASFQRGLRSMTLTLATQIRGIRRAKEEPVLCALGGFKAEVAYATLVGALFELPNHYIHQGFDEVLQIPPLPVTWDYAEIDAYEETLSWLENGPRTEFEVRSRLAAIPDRLKEALTEVNEGCVYLSPLGIAYFESYQDQIEMATNIVYLSSKAWAAYSGMEVSVQAAYDHQLKKLRVPDIRRSNSKSLDRKNGDVLVYPRGHIDERLYWYEHDGKAYVVKLARHEDGYYDGAVNKKDYIDSEWTPWPII